MRREVIRINLKSFTLPFELVSLNARISPRSDDKITAQRGPFPHQRSAQRPACGLGDRRRYRGSVGIGDGDYTDQVAGERNRRDRRASRYDLDDHWRAATEQAG